MLLAKSRLFGSCLTHAIIREIFGVEWPRQHGCTHAVIGHRPTLYKVRRHASVHGEQLQQGYPGMYISWMPVPREKGALKSMQPILWGFGHPGSAEICPGLNNTMDRCQKTNLVSYDMPYIPGLASFPC